MSVHSANILRRRSGRPDTRTVTDAATEGAAVLVHRLCARAAGPATRSRRTALDPPGAVRRFPTIITGFMAKGLPR